MKGVTIFLAEGFEDVEALATCDVLRRGGVPVQLVSITDEPFVVSSHRVAVGADDAIDTFLRYAEFKGTDEKDVMIFPGGMPGTKNLAANEMLMSLMQEHYDDGGTVAAICAAPGLVLGQLEDIEGKRMTCFDGFEKIIGERGAKFVPKPAITDGRIITGRSAGHAVAFGLEILKKVKGEKAAADVRHAMMLETV
ncbi:MAG: DJ-1/PfpI family protein [Bacteroidia bacterium]|nr:DJ-1/PfpI family protein [Bacteroidia bacterium]